MPITLFCVQKVEKSGNRMEGKPGITMVMLLLTIFMYVTGDKRGENIPISVATGVYWKEVKTVLYESSVPLVYKSRWPNVDMAHLSLPKMSGFCNETLNDPECMLFQWILQTDKIVGKQIRWLNASLQTAETGLTGAKQAQRNKRSLSFVGNFAHWCCGVATKRQLRPLVTNQQEMAHFEVELQERLSEAFTEIDNTNLNMQNYSKQVEATFTQIVDVGLNITKVIERFQRLEFVTEQRNDYKSFSLLQLGVHHVIRHLQTIQLVTRLEIQSQCRERKIPNSVLTLEKLQKDLVVLSRSLQEDGYDLAIPYEEVTKYLKLEIVECMISGNEIIINLSVPIRKQGSQWKLYEPIAVPFAWENNTCTVQHRVSFLAVDQNQIRSIRGSAIKDCQPHEESLCFVPRYASDAVYGSLCPKKMFLGASIQELSTECIFSCVTETATLINKVGDFSYVLTHAHLPLDLNCRYNKNKTFTAPHLRKLGALEITVPCDCSLIYKDEVLVSESYPCDKTPLVSQVIHVLPAPWSKLKSLKIPPLQSHVSSTFSTLDECLDEHWPTQIPHWNLSLTKPFKLQNPVLNLPTRQADWYATVSAAMHGIFIVLVTVIVFRNPHLIGFGFQQVVRAEFSSFESKNSEAFLIDVIFSIIIVFCFVFGIRLLMRIVKRWRSKSPTQNVELVAKKDTLEDDNLPKGMPITEVDGRELRITLEWWSPEK